MPETQTPAAPNYFAPDRHEESGRRPIGMPTSETLDFVPSPHTTDPEVVASMSPEELLLAQQAYNVFQAPGNFVENQQRKYGRVAQTRDFRDHIDFHAEVGMDTYTQAFKALRRLAGEEEYQGIELVPIPSDQRTTLREFLEIAAGGGIPVAEEWASHDIMLHSIGALLATGDVAKVIRTGARAALRLPKAEQVAVGDDIDIATDTIRRMWRFPDSREQSLDTLAKVLTDIRTRTGINYCDDEDVLYFAADQEAAITNLSRTPLFMDPGRLAKQTRQAA